MILKVFKTKVYALIEELNPNSPWLTDDEDLKAKVNEVINQVMFDMACVKKIPRYAEIKVNEGDVLTFTDIGAEVGNEVYQLGTVGGVKHVSKADGTVLKFLEDGVAEVDLYVYPERITDKTKDAAYEFELAPEAVEAMVYGVCADLLKADVSANYGTVYAKKYDDLKQMMDIRYQVTSISVEGGFGL